MRRGWVLCLRACYLLNSVLWPYIIPLHFPRILLESTLYFFVASREYRRLFGEAMKDGYIHSLINKIVMYGASGTGKSSFMDLVTGNPPACFCH
jgi:hypothetical protein